jgi:hypothetical protein
VADFGGVCLMLKWFLRVDGPRLLVWIGMGRPAYPTFVEIAGIGRSLFVGDGTWNGRRGGMIG